MPSLSATAARSKEPFTWLTATLRAWVLICSSLEPIFSRVKFLTQIVLHNFHEDRKLLLNQCFGHLELMFLMRALTTCPDFIGNLLFFFSSKTPISCL